MPRYLKINILCILFLALSFPAASELYQYIDENGIMRLTDTIYSVPVAERAQLEQFDEFEDLSNELTILPIPSKPAPQKEDQAKVKKDIYPKTAKEISAETEKNVVSESKEKTTDPVQPIYSDKAIEEPDTKVSSKQLHKSKRITIRKIDKKSPSQKTALIKTPEKSIKKKTEPPKTPKTEPESIIIEKDQSPKIIAKKPMPIPESKTKAIKETPTKDIVDAEKSATASKTIQVKPETSSQKSAGPDIINQDTIKPGALEPDALELNTAKSETAKTDTTKPVITKKPAPETTQKVVPTPEKPSEIKSAQKADTPTVVKKEAKPADIITDKKPIDSQKSDIVHNEKIKQNSTQSELKENAIPETKPENIIVKKEPSIKITAQKPEEIPASKSKKATSPKVETVEPKTITTAKVTGTAAPPLDVEKPPKPDTKEKQAEIKSALNTDSSAVVKKQPKVENIINDKKTAPHPKVQSELPVKDIEKATQSELKKKATPEIKPESKIVKKETKVENIINDKKTASHPKVQYELSGKDIEKTTQPEIVAKTIPEIRKTDPDKPDYISVKKDSETAVATYKPDSKKLPETIKTEPDTLQITPKKSELIEKPAHTKHNETTTVAKSQKIEADNSKVTQKDESIVLAKLESTRKTLSNKKEALNKKFMDLMKEKQEIEDSVDEDDEKSVLQYNENVKKLNFKIKQYKTEKKFLQAEIEKYNHAIKQSALN